MKLSDIERIEGSNNDRINAFKSRLIKGVHIDVVNNHAGIVEIKDDLDEYYKYCNCDLIDVSYNKINGVYVGIIIDDEGLLKDGYKISAFDSDGRGVLVGNLLVFSGKVDPDGRTIGLTEDECKRVLRNVFYCCDRDGGIYPALVGVDAAY